MKIQAFSEKAKYVTVARILLPKDYGSELLILCSDEPLEIERWVADWPNRSPYPIEIVCSNSLALALDQVRLTISGAILGNCGLTNSSDGVE